MDDFRLNSDIYQRIPTSILFLSQAAGEMPIQQKLPNAMIMNHLFRFFGSPYRIRIDTGVKDNGAKIWACIAIT